MANPGQDKKKGGQRGAASRDARRAKQVLAGLGTEAETLFNDLAGRISNSLKKGATEGEKAFGDMAKILMKDFQDVEFAATQVGKAGYANLDYSAKLREIAKEKFDIEHGLSDLTKEQAAERLIQLETDEASYEVLQSQADVLNRKNAILARGNALIDGMKKSWEDISATIISTVTTWQGAVVTSMALNKHVGGIAQNLGVAHTEAMGFAATGALLGPMFKAMGLDVAQSQKALLDNFNDMDAASIQNVANMGLLQLQTGVTADTAAKASRMFSLIEGSTAAAGISMTKQVADQAKLAGAIPAKVIEDMTANSASIAEYWSGNIESLTAAAAQASKLGLSISNISSAASGLLNIEQSIAAEMEAEVLLGKNLNLEKAREAALMGDSETLMQELIKNAGSLEEFNNMNVIQKQKLAAALGLNVADLQKMVQEEKTSSTTWGKITSEASKYATWISGAVPGAMALANNAMRLKDNLMNLPWGKLGSMFKSGGAADAVGPLTKSGKPDMRYAANRPAAPKAPKPGPGAAMAKTGRGVGGAATSMLKGAAAMLIMGAALWVAAKGFQELAKVDWGALWPGAVIALIALAGAMALFGIGPVAVLLLTGAAVFAGMSIGLMLFGVALMAVGKGIQLTKGGLTGFGAIIGELIPLVPGLFALGAAFGIMGIGLISLSAGLIALVPALPVIMALGAMATLALAMGGAGGGAEGEVMEMKSSSIEDKLDALTVAILAQPIQIQLDGKNVGWGVKNAQNKAVDFA